MENIKVVVYAQHCCQAGKSVCEEDYEERPNSDDFMVFEGTAPELLRLAADKIENSAKVGGSNGLFQWKIAMEIIDAVRLKG